MIAAILRWLPLSLALHSAALAVALLLPGESVLPLFVDLTLSEPITAPDAPSGFRDSAAPPRRPRTAPDSRRVAAAPTSPARAAVSAPTSPAPTPTAPMPEPESLPPATAMPPAAVSPAPESAPELPVAPARPPSPVGISPQAGPPSASTTSAAGAGSASGAASGGGRDTAVSAPGLDGDAGGASVRGGTGTGGETLAFGVAAEDGGVYAGYIALLRRRVQEALAYPSAARRRGMSGTVHLDISVEPTGRIADVLVVRSSSHDVLDTAALDAVRALRQVPFPPGLRPRAVRVRLPVVFELR